MLHALPLVFVLVGLALYAVLGGRRLRRRLLAAVRRPRRATAERIREHAHHSMGPVWEANHVWLIFVLTVFWTAYPAAFGSIASTLAVPLFIAAIGIIFRGAAYALRAGRVERARVGRDRHDLLALLDPDAVRARRRGRRDRDRPRAGRQRRRAPVLELAEPDLDLHRRARGRQLRVPRRRVPRRGRRPARRRASSSERSAAARWSPGWSPARVAIAGLFVLNRDDHRALPRAARRAARWPR